MSNTLQKNNAAVVKAYFDFVKFVYNYEIEITDDKNFESYKDFIDSVVRQILNSMDSKIIREKYGLNEEGNKMSVKQIAAENTSGAALIRANISRSIRKLRSVNMVRTILSDGCFFEKDDVKQLFLPEKIYTILKENGIEKISILQKYSEKELMTLKTSKYERSLGKKSVQLIKEAIAKISQEQSSEEKILALLAERKELQNRIQFIDELIEQISSNNDGE